MPGKGDALPTGHVGIGTNTGGGELALTIVRWLGTFGHDQPYARPLGILVDSQLTGRIRLIIRSQPKVNE